MTSYDVYSGDRTALAVKINSTQTSNIKLAAMSINGSTVAVANTGPGVIEITEEVEGALKREWIYFTTGTTNSDNTFTLSATGIQRDVSRTAASLTGSGTGQSFNKGATVRFVNFHYIYNQKADVDRAETITSAWTFGTAGEALFSGTDKAGLVVKSLTTTQRDALAAVTNGSIIYNSTLGQTQYYEGGAWVTNASGGSLSNGSTTVAGKFEEATVAEQGSATATGGTGARLLPAVANLVKAGAGAGDENKIAILNASGAYNVSVGGTGAVTLTANNVILGNGTNAVQFVAPGTSGNVLKSDGSTWTSGSQPSFSLAKRYLLTSDKTTTSGTFADIDGTNFTVSVSCTASTILIMTVSGAFGNSGANAMSLDFSVGGSRLGGTLGLVDFNAVAGSNHAISLSHTMVPGAGTITVKPQWRTTAGTATMVNSLATGVFTVLKLEP